MEDDVSHWWVKVVEQSVQVYSCPRIDPLFVELTAIVNFCSNDGTPVDDFGWCTPAGIAIPSDEFTDRKVTVAVV